MLELAIVKRKAKFTGEIGLFGVDAVADEEMKRLVNDELAWAEITTPRNIELLRYLWAIAQKLADGGLYADKNDSMEDLKIRARFAKFVMDGNKVVIVPRSLSKQRRDVLSRLADRFVYLVCSELLPGMPEGQFRREVEELVS